MGQFRNIIGEMFGELEVIGYSNKRASNGGVYWLCKCSCGKEKEIMAQSLLSGNAKTCGHNQEINLKKAEN